MSPAKVSVRPLGHSLFRVKVEEGSSLTTHDVAVPRGFLEKVAWSKTPEELIRSSFKFLLEREPKESILESFELPAISQYFPEYDQAVRSEFA